MVKPRINRTAVKHMLKCVRVFACEGGVQAHRDVLVVQYIFNDGCIALFGDALKTVVEIVVIVIKAHGQTFQNTGG